LSQRRDARAQVREETSGTAVAQVRDGGISMRVLCTILFLTAGCAAAPKAACVAPAPAVPAVGRTVDLELTDTTAAGSRTTHYVLSVVDDHGWSKLYERTATDRLELRAASNLDHRGFPAIVRVELDRNAQGAPDVHIEQSTIFYAGRRTVLGHVEGAGGTTEIAMVTR
jgi:hypothetical protein